MRWRSLGISCGVAAALVTAWELLALYGPWPDHLLPRATEVFATFAQLSRDGRMHEAVLESMDRLLRGYALALLLGLPLGVLLGRVEPAREVLRPVIAGLQALPSICWLPLALLWFGLSEAAIVFVVVMGSLTAIAVATEDAVRSIDPNLDKAARGFGIRGLRMALGVHLMAAMPGVVTALKLGWSFAWRALLAGELLFMSGGLGQLLTAGRELLRISQVIAVMLAIALIGVAIDRALFQTVEKRVRRRWGLGTG